MVFSSKYKNGTFLYPAPNVGKPDTKVAGTVLSRGLVAKGEGSVKLHFFNSDSKNSISVEKYGGPDI